MKGFVLRYECLCVCVCITTYLMHSRVKPRLYEIQPPTTIHRSHNLKIVLCERYETAGNVLKFLTGCHMLRASVSYRLTLL